MARRLLEGMLAFSTAAIACSAAAQTSLTRTSAFEYDPTSGLLIREVIEPNNSTLCLVTTYTYDTFGNKTGATTRNCNGTSSGGVTEAPTPTGDPVFASRTSTTAYASGSTVIGGVPYSWSAGQFPTTSTNALGHTETKEFDPRFGTVTKLTGPNGLVTTWTYDGFGRKSTETRSDGTTTSWTYNLCGACPTHGKMFVTETSTGAPTKTVYLDSLNREIRSEVQGFDGTLVRKDTEYDNLGRVKQVSKPYYAGATPVWTTYELDDLNRVTRVDEPSTSGGATRTTTGYNGLVTTVTVSNAGGGTNLPGGLAQTRTTTKNSQGQVTQVTDSQSNNITYTYNPFGNLKTTNAGGVITTLTYDLRGRKTQMVDRDMGTWSYAYNALGELIRQTDAKNQVTTMAYDKLGRMTSRTEPDLVSTWFYDAYQGGGACAKGIGKLCQVSATNSYGRTITYDAQGRVSSLSTNIDTSYAISYTYDSVGRLNTTTYPTAFAVQNVYNAFGYLWKVQRFNNPDTTTYWQANGQNAAGQVTDELLGNGLTTTFSYDALFRMTVVQSANAGGAVHHLAYSFDAIGNVTQRVDNVQAITENFGYDTLNRLLSASGPGLTTRSFTYNAIGNMTHKSDVGTYTYPSITAARPHAVSSVTNGGTPNSLTASYTYDANGSLITTTGTIYPASGSTPFSRWVSYTAANMPSNIVHSQGSSVCTKTVNGVSRSGRYCYTYTYSAEHERVRLVTIRPNANITSVYLHPAGKGALLYEKELRCPSTSSCTATTTGAVTEHKHYVNGGSGLVGVFVTKSTYSSGDGPQMRYYHRDHLGSIAVITNPSGAVLERLSYEAFGERRNANGTPQNRVSPLFGVTTDRGFTGHEHLDELNLIHMNGRIYDPALGRFMTADPFVQAAVNLQSHNRYSYVFNNPLMYTDPSGYLSLKKIAKSVTKRLEKAWKKVWHSEIGRIAITAVAAWYVGPLIGEFLAANASWAVSASWGASEFAAAGYTLSGAGAAAAGAGTGFVTGMVGSGGDFEAGLYGAISGGVGGGFVGAGTLGQMTGSGINGYLQTGDTRGFVRGFAAGALPQDLWLGDVYRTVGPANVAIGALRDGLRGTLIAGDSSGFGPGVKYGQATNAIGHLVGFGTTFSAPTFQDGAFFYEGSFWSGGAMTLGNVISGPTGISLHPQSQLYRHERGHIPQSIALGALYIPAHALSLTVAQLLPPFDHHSRLNLLENYLHQVPHDGGRSSPHLDWFYGTSFK